jgi:hypothetical protein
MVEDHFSLLGGFEDKAFGGTGSAFEDIGATSVDVGDLPTPDSFRRPLVAVTIPGNTSYTLTFNAGGNQPTVYWGDGSSTSTSSGVFTKTYNNTTPDDIVYGVYTAGGTVNGRWSFGFDLSNFAPDVSYEFFWDALIKTSSTLKLKDVIFDKPIPGGTLGRSGTGTTINLENCQIPGPIDILHTGYSNLFIKNNKFTGPLPKLSSRKYQVQNNRFSGELPDTTGKSLLESFLVYNQEDGNTYSRIYPKVMLTGRIRRLDVNPNLEFYHVGAGDAWQRGFKNQLTVDSDFAVAPALSKFFASNCQISTEGVDKILNAFASITTTNPITIDLSGTNGYPTAAGLADRDTLVAAGWTVNLPALS